MLAVMDMTSDMDHGKASRCRPYHNGEQQCVLNHYGHKKHHGNRGHHSHQGKHGNQGFHRGPHGHHKRNISHGLISCSPPECRGPQRSPYSERGPSRDACGDHGLTCRRRQGNVLGSSHRCDNDPPRGLCEDDSSRYNLTGDDGLLHGPHEVCSLPRRLREFHGLRHGLRGNYGLKQGPNGDYGLSHGHCDHPRCLGTKSGSKGHHSIRQGSCANERSLSGHRRLSCRANRGQGSTISREDDQCQIRGFCVDHNSPCGPHRDSSTPCDSHINHYLTKGSHENHGQGNYGLPCGPRRSHGPKTSPGGDHSPPCVTYKNQGPPCDPHGYNGPCQIRDREYSPLGGVCKSPGPNCRKNVPPKRHYRETSLPCSFQRAQGLMPAPCGNYSSPQNRHGEQYLSYGPNDHPYEKLGQHHCPRAGHGPICGPKSDHSPSGRPKYIAQCSYDIQENYSLPRGPRRSHGPKSDPRGAHSPPCATDVNEGQLGGPHRYYGPHCISEGEHNAPCNPCEGHGSKYRKGDHGPPQSHRGEHSLPCSSQRDQGLCGHRSSLIDPHEDQCLPYGPHTDGSHGNENPHCGGGNKKICPHKEDHSSGINDSTRCPQGDIRPSCGPCGDNGPPHGSRGVHEPLRDDQVDECPPSTPQGNHGSPRDAEEDNGPSHDQPCENHGKSREIAQKTTVHVVSFEPIQEQPSCDPEGKNGDTPINEPNKMPPGHNN